MRPPIGQHEGRIGCGILRPAPPAKRAVPSFSRDSGSRVEYWDMRPPCRATLAAIIALLVPASLGAQTTSHMSAADSAAAARAAWGRAVESMRAKDIATARRE